MIEYLTWGVLALCAASPVIFYFVQPRAEREQPLEGVAETGRAVMIVGLVILAVIAVGALLAVGWGLVR